MADADLSALRDEALHLRILRAGAVTTDRRWNFRNIHGVFWRLYIQRDPGSALIVGNRRIPLLPDRMYLVPPWLRFSCSCDGLVRSLYLHVDATGLPAALVRELVPLPVALPADPDLDRLGVRLEGLLRQPEADALVIACQAKAFAFQAFAGLAASLPRTGAARWLALMQGRHRVSHALAWIDDFLAQPVVNAQLAGMCGLSEGEFIRVFSRVVGQTPARYVQERRLARACARLAHGDEAIAAIATDCGFANRYHFSRVFARRFGMGPAAWRKRSNVAPASAGTDGRLQPAAGHDHE